MTLLRIDPETNRPVRRAREQMLVFQTDGAVPWAPATPDRFQVALVVGRGRNKLELHESAPTRLDVRMLVAGQTIEIVPEPGALAAALAGLKD